MMVPGAWAWAPGTASRSTNAAKAIQTIVAQIQLEKLNTSTQGKISTLDLASVYRNLETLERVGIVRHVHLGHGPGLYALAGAREREYLVCDRCGRVEAVESDRLERTRATIRADFGYDARFTHFPIVGICADCRRAGLLG